MNISENKSMKHGSGEPIDSQKEAHRLEMIEIQKERIELAKYITVMSLGVSTGIYIFIGATIGGVAENIADDATLADTLISFLDANRLTVILICALAAFLIAIVTGVVVVLNHIKNWGNASKPYDYRERLMITFAFFGILFLLGYLLVISWKAFVPIVAYGQIVFASFLVICLLVAFIYSMVMLIRMVREVVLVFILFIRLIFDLAKLTPAELNQKIALGIKWIVILCLFYLVIQLFGEQTGSGWE